MDDLLGAAGIKPEIDIELSDDAAENLQEAAQAFLTAGGVVSLAEWARLTTASREAFVAAGLERDGDRLLRMTAAMAGPQAAAEAIAHLDGGDAARQLAVDAAAKKAADKVKPKAPPANRQRRGRRIG